MRRAAIRAMTARPAVAKSSTLGSLQRYDLTYNTSNRRNPFAVGVQRGRPLPLSHGRSPALFLLFVPTRRVTSRVSLRSLQPARRIPLGKASISLTGVGPRRIYLATAYGKFSPSVATKSAAPQRTSNPCQSCGRIATSPPWKTSRRDHTRHMRSRQARQAGAATALEGGGDYTGSYAQ